MTEPIYHHAASLLLCEKTLSEHDGAERTGNGNVLWKDYIRPMDYRWTGATRTQPISAKGTFPVAFVLVEGSANGTLIFGLPYLLRTTRGPRRYIHHTVHTDSSSVVADYNFTMFVLSVLGNVP